MTTPADSLPIFEPALQERQPIASRLLTAALFRQALSNAYLLTGRAGADKWLIAQQLAAFLNCMSRKTDEYASCLSKSKRFSEKQQTMPSNSATLGPDGKIKEKTAEAQSLAAGFCQNCLWISQGEHPQAWLILAGQGESGKIPVEKARQLTDELNKTSRYMRVVLIPHAEQDCLHAAPANALLKSIEEPHDNALFLLFAASSEQVLPTIVSRSQVIPVMSRFKPGLWLSTGGSLSAKNVEAADGAVSTDNANTEKSGANLASIRSEFIQAARKSLSGTSSLHGSYLKTFSESQDLGERLRLLADAESAEPELLIDLFLASELEVLRDISSQEPRISLYLNKLAELSEISKNQLNHYVRKNNVLETFAFSLTELRLKYLGDFHLAKN